MKKSISKLAEEVKALTPEELEELKSLTGLDGAHTNSDPHQCPPGQIWDEGLQRCIDKL